MDNWDRAEKCTEEILARIAELELQARIGYSTYASPPKVKDEIRAAIMRLLESLETQEGDQ